MAKPWMPLYVADYLSDTTHLSAAEHGAYMLLIMHYWQHGCLPDDDARLAIICRMQLQEFCRAKEVLKSYFDDGWKHKRIEAELSKAEEISQKRRESALKRHKTPNKKPANGYANRVQKQTHSHSPSISVSKETHVSTDLRKAFENYNVTAKELNLPMATKLTAERRRKLRARLDEFGLTGWNQALQNLCDQPFCLGQGGRGWKANLDFLLQPTSLTKVLEKAYADAELPAAS